MAAYIYVNDGYVFVYCCRDIFGQIKTFHSEYQFDIFVLFFSPWSELKVNVPL